MQNGFLDVIIRFFHDSLETERPHIIVWLPVGVGIGIGLYFACSHEPSLWWLGTPFILALFALRWAWLWPFVVVAVGFCAALGKSTYLHTPQITHERPPLTLKGTLEKVELRSQDTRLTLSHVYDEKDRSLNLAVIRLSCRGQLCQQQVWQPGQQVQLRCVLLPPQGPAHPYGYDFRRQAYFEGIGAVGYILAPPVLVKDVSQDHKQLTYLRHCLTQFLRSHLKGLTGEIAAALITGDRSGIPSSIRDAFADAGVAHVLAISGLHLSLVAGIFFFFIRTLLAFIPFIALRWNTKKIAACCAFMGITGYLILCGAPLPALRAYIMTSLILGAVMIDRFALGLRNVAIAATALLLFIPEALISPSFQLSFAAVVILIAGYERYYGPLQSWMSYRPWPGKGLVLYGLAIILSTLLSTLATTPYVVYTFHRFTLHAIPANMLVIPLVSFVIMPGLVLFLILGSFGQALGLPYILEKSLTLMITLSQEISQWKGSNIPVKAMPTPVLVMLTFGLLFFFLMKSRLRWGGLGLMVVGLIGLWQSQPPTLFISHSGCLVGLYRSNQPLQVNTLQKERYARKSWITHCGYKTARKNKELVASLPSGLKKIFEETLAQSRGATYVWVTDNKATYLSVKEVVGQRPWSLP